MREKIFLLIALLLFLWSVPQGYPQEKVRVGYGAISVQSGLVWIAKDKGLFAKYGLMPEIVYIPGGSTNVQVLISGNLDYSQLSGAPGVAANLAGADIVYIAGFGDRLNYQLITRPEIKNLEQLKGKKLAVSRFASSADFGMRAILKRLGLDPVKDVTILQVGDEPARLAAVKSGSVDGTVMNAPFGLEAQRQNLYILADSLKMGIPFFNTGLLATRRFLDQNEARTLNLLRAYVEAIKIFKTDRDYSLKALARFTRVNNVTALEEGYEYFKSTVRDVPYPSLEGMQAVVAQMAETSAKTRQPDAAAFISDRYLKQLESDGFVKKVWGK